MPQAAREQLAKTKAAEERAAEFERLAADKVSPWHSHIPLPRLPSGARMLGVALPNEALHGRQHCFAPFARMHDARMCTHTPFPSGVASSNTSDSPIKSASAG